MVSRYKSFYIYYSIDRDLTTNNKKTQNQPSKNCSDLKLLADQSKTSESWSIFRGQLNANKMFRVISSTYNCFLNDCFKFVSATEEGLLLFGSFVSLLFVFFSFNHLAAKAKSRHADQSIYFLGSHSLTTAKVT